MRESEPSSLDGDVSMSSFERADQGDRLKVGMSVGGYGRFDCSSLLWSMRCLLMCVCLLFTWCLGGTGAPLLTC